MVYIISRSEWGAKAPTKPSFVVPMSERQYLFAHYLGAEDAKLDRVAQLRSVQAYHLTKWSDIGYNFVIDQDGKVYEGRGRNAVGAHSPGFNRNGIGVLFMLGDDDDPTAAAKASFVELRADLERIKGGRKLTVKGHRDARETACPGQAVYTWLQAGLPVVPHNVPVESKVERPVSMGTVIMKGATEQAFLTDGLTMKRWIKSVETVQAMRMDGYRYVEGPEYTSVLASLTQGSDIA